MKVFPLMTSFFQFLNIFASHICLLWLLSSEQNPKLAQSGNLDGNCRHEVLRFDEFSFSFCCVEFLWFCYKKAWDKKNHGEVKIHSFPFAHRIECTTICWTISVVTKILANFREVFLTVAFTFRSLLIDMSPLHQPFVAQKMFAFEADVI